MRTIFSGLLVISLLVLYLVQMTACTSTTTGVSPSLSGTLASPAITPGLKETGQQTSTPIALTLEEAEKELKDKGYTVVDTIEKASQLAGYQVATPSFIPEGFLAEVISNAGTFRVNILGFGLPTSEFRKYPLVSQVFRPGGLLANEPFLILTQSKDPFGTAGNPVDIDVNGHTGKKVLTPPDEKYPARLLLVWSDSDLFYSLEGVLISPLDETVLLKVASSVGIH